MQSSAWNVLLRRIPPEHHDSLAIVTTVGIEITIQDIVRIEEDHLVIRGRLAATAQGGRIFFIPYNQINYLGFQKEVRVAQIMAMYGEAPAAPMAEPKARALSPRPGVAEPAATEAKPDAPASPTPPPPPEVNPPSEAAAQLKIPRRSGVLERLRARAQAGINTRPPPSNP